MRSADLSQTMMDSLILIMLYLEEPIVFVEIFHFRDK